MTAGSTLPGSTTLATLLDTVFTNKSAGLTGATAVFTAIDPVTLEAGWAGKDDLIYIRFEQRSTSPDFIAL